jgi:LPXTG-motif cell wall-anchored protein
MRPGTWRAEAKMFRRQLLLAAASLIAGLGLLAGPAMAGQSPPVTTVPTTAPPTTAPPTTTTTVPTTTPPTVSPTTIEQTTTTEAPTTTTETPPSVGGVVIPQQLPRTGGEFGMEVILGAGLTAAGLAFAASARLRRQRANAPDSN